MPPENDNGDDVKVKSRRAPPEEQGGKTSGLVTWAKENPGWAIAVLLITVAVGVYFYMKNRNTGQVSQILPETNAGSNPGAGITSIPTPLQEPAPPITNPGTPKPPPPLPVPPSSFPKGTVVLPPGSLVPGTTAANPNAPPPANVIIPVLPGEGVPDYGFPGSKPPIIPPPPNFGGPNPDVYVPYPMPTGGPKDADKAKPYANPTHNYHQIGASEPVIYYGMQYNYPGFDLEEIPANLGIQQFPAVMSNEPGYAGVGASPSGALLAVEYTRAQPANASPEERAAQAPAMSKQVAEKVKRGSKK